MSLDVAISMSMAVIMLLFNGVNNMTDTLNDLKQAYEATDLVNHCECFDTVIEDNEADNADDFIEWFNETYIHSAEIIYYHNAIDYLKENDPSLRESLGLAADYGYELASLNSEELATLLLQSNLSDELHGLHSELEAYFDELSEADDE